jgi:outer membrane biogenesis lipoprotein LolB
MRRACGHAHLAGVPLVALSCLLAACTTMRPVTPHRAPAVLPSVADLDATLAARRAAVHSLRALARLRYHDAEQSVTSREAIVVARPDRVRVEVLSLFGAVFLLVADNGQMTAYAREENTVYRGQASPHNLQRYVGLGLPVDELVDVVLGTPPPRDGPAQVSFDAAAGAICLRRSFADGAQSIWFSDAALPVATEELGADGAPHWRAAFSAYEERNGVPIATQIGLDLPSASQSLEIALQDIEVNPPLDHSIFAFQAPSGSKVVDLRPLSD